MWHYLLFGESIVNMKMREQNAQEASHNARVRNAQQQSSKMKGYNHV
jgi:hypothetical protein